MTIGAVQPPSPAQMVCWPASFGHRFLVSVDVEEEFDWSLPPARAPRAVTHMAALRPWHDAMRRAGVAPLYLCDYPVVRDRVGAEVLRALAAEGGAIGAQLHPWVNPPFGDPADEPATEAATFAGNLPPALEGAKLDVLMEEIATATGRVPIAYRAGRYGIGTATASLLAERGVRLDVSMRARHDYASAGGPDFRAIGSDAFRLGEGVVEVPLSTVDIGLLRRSADVLDRLAARVPHGRGLLARSGLLSRVPLTPEGVSEAEARRAIAVAAADGTRLLQLAFHSPSLVPGHTPYVRDAADLAKLHHWWDTILQALAETGYTPVTAEELIEAAR